jgi:hypothetical protein
MTEVVYPLHAHNIILSIAGGVLLGGILCWKLRFPSGWGGFAAVLIVALVSPWFAVHTMLLSLERQWVIHWNIFAVGMFAAVAVVFVCRLLQKPKVSERPKLTKYL